MDECDIVKAITATVHLSDDLPIDGYMLPDGELRAGIGGASMLLCHGKDWFNRLASKAPEKLKAFQEAGFTGRLQLVSISRGKGKRGASRAQTVSLKDLTILIAVDALLGNKRAIAIQSAFTLEGLDSRFRDAFGIRQRTLEEKRQFFGLTYDDYLDALTDNREELEQFYTDSNGHAEPSPRFYRQGEKRLKFRQKRVSRKKKGSANRRKAINRLGRVHLKISRQREEHAKKLARCVIQSNDLVAYEDLRIKNLMKKRCDPASAKDARERAPRHHCLAKSINDAGWYQFRKWLEYFGVKFGRVTVAVNPAYTSQQCSSCGSVAKKSLSTRTHVCQCGFVLDRDWNAAINILNSALSTVGHTGTWVIDPSASPRFDLYLGWRNPV